MYRQQCSRRCNSVHFFFACMKKNILYTKWLCIGRFTINNSLVISSFKTCKRRKFISRLRYRPDCVTRLLMPLMVPCFVRFGFFIFNLLFNCSWPSLLRSLKKTVVELLRAVHMAYWWSPKKTALVHFSSVGRAPTSATQPSVQLDLVSETICRRTSDSRTCHTDSR